MLNLQRAEHLLGETVREMGVLFSLARWSPEV